MSDMERRSRVPGLADRMAEAINAAGLNKHRVSTLLGAAQTTVNSWLGNGEPSLVYLLEFADLCGVRVMWLLTGAGPMRATGSEGPESLRAFLGSTGDQLDEEERQHFRAQSWGFDPGQEWWSDYLLRRRAVKKKAVVAPVAFDESASAPTRQADGESEGPVVDFAKQHPRWQKIEPDKHGAVLDEFLRVAYSRPDDLGQGRLEGAFLAACEKHGAGVSKVRDRAQVVHVNRDPGGMHRKRRTKT